MMEKYKRFGFEELLSLDKELFLKVDSIEKEIESDVYQHNRKELQLFVETIEKARQHLRGALLREIKDFNERENNE